jgi:hypothetical protein
MEQAGKRQVLETEEQMANKAVYFQKNLDRPVLL